MEYTLLLGDLAVCWATLL